MKEKEKLTNPKTVSAQKESTAKGNQGSRPLEQTGLRKVSNPGNNGYNRREK